MKVSQIFRVLIYHFLYSFSTALKNETARLVSDAVKAGFRFIDTACQPKHYNEAGVGDGWKAAAEELGLSREDGWLQTKFTPLKIGRAHV